MSAVIQNYWCSTIPINVKYNYQQITTVPMNNAGSICMQFPLQIWNFENIKCNNLSKYQPTSWFSVSQKKNWWCKHPPVCVFSAGAAQSGVRRSLGMQLAAGAAKRRRFSMTLLTSCLYPTASALTWIRPPSWGWLSASCAHASCSLQVWTLYHTHKAHTYSHMQAAAWLHLNLSHKGKYANSGWPPPASSLTR